MQFPTAATYISLMKNVQTAYEVHLSSYSAQNMALFFIVFLLKRDVYCSLYLVLRLIMLQLYIHPPVYLYTEYRDNSKCTFAFYKKKQCDMHVA